jgi:hypothetical protein
VPVSFGDVQISVPATWDITFGCPTGPGSVYLGSATKDFCPLEVSVNTVVLATATSASFPSASPGVVNHIPIEWLNPSDTAMQVPSLDASVDATGPLAGEVLGTLTYSPRAVTLAPGASPSVPRSWYRVSFGGLSAAVPRSWPVEHQADWSLGCSPINLSLSEQQVLLSLGTTELAPSCPDLSSSNLSLPTYHDGLVIDPGPYGPIPADASFGPCLHIHRLRVCPTTTDAYGVLVLSIHVPGATRPVAVEIGLAGSGITARTILDSLRAG